MNEEEISQLRIWHFLNIFHNRQLLVWMKKWLRIIHSIVTMMDSKIQKEQENIQHIKKTKSVLDFPLEILYGKRRLM